MSKTTRGIAIAVAIVVVFGAFQIININMFSQPTPEAAVNTATPKTAVNGTMVSVHYTGRLQDGTVFDSSIERGQPIQFMLGAGQVIKGWDEGIYGMKVGEKKTLTIPPEKAYGAAGYPPVIPANATLIFDVELVDVTNQ